MSSTKTAIAIADRIQALVPKVAPETVGANRNRRTRKMKLRHAPLLIVRAMAASEKHRPLVAATLERVIQRPDEMTEFLAIYWSDVIGPHAAAQKASGAGPGEKGPRQSLREVRRLSTREVRPRRAGAPARRALPHPRQTRERRPGESLEGPRRRQARRARHVGGQPLRRRVEEGNVRTPDRRKEARRAGAPA